METLIAGKSTFKLQVPYKLIKTGSQEKKPLIVYFHGYGDTIESFQSKLSSVLELDAFHLFIQGPFALKLNPKEEKRKGYSYYLYDSDDSYLNSIEYTSEFIQEIIDHVRQIVQVTRITLIGYSMGAYLAGYWGFTRWKHTNDIFMLNGRLKTELFNSKIENQEVLKHINVFGLNGKKDLIVDPLKQQKELEYLNENGMKSTFKLVDSNHKLSSILIHELISNMLDLGFIKISNNQF